MSRRRPTRLVSAVALVLAAATAACGGDDDDEVVTPAPPEVTTTTVAAESTTAPPAVTEPAPTLEGVTVNLVEVAQLESPTAMAVRSGDPSLYVAEQAGRLQRITVENRPEGTIRYQVQRSAVIDLSDEIVSGGEQGLLGVAFSSDGRRLYLAYTGGDEQQYVDEFTMDDSSQSTVTADVDTRRPLLAVPDFAPNHNGGQLALGPDGFLWYGMGDGGGGGDPEDTGQDPSDLLGALLRIDPQGGDPYGIPDGNPFKSGGGAPEVFAFGLRNPWRFSFDAETGDLWIADVGQGEVEEIDFVPAASGQGAGANFGWNRLEGDQSFEGDPPEDAVAPIHTYGHGDGRCSVTGGFVYRGERIPALQGAYVYGDYCDGRLRALIQRDGAVVAEGDLGQTVPSLSSFGQDGSNELYALSLTGPVYRIDPPG